MESARSGKLDVAFRPPHDANGGAIPSQFLLGLTWAQARNNDTIGQIPAGPSVDRQLRSCERKTVLAGALSQGRVVSCLLRSAMIAVWCKTDDRPDGAKYL